jgi:hypothetical protein
MQHRNKQQHKHHVSSIRDCSSLHSLERVSASRSGRETEGEWAWLPLDLGRAFSPREVRWVWWGLTWIIFNFSSVCQKIKRSARVPQKRCKNVTFTTTIIIPKQCYHHKANSVLLPHVYSSRRSEMLY